LGTLQRLEGDVRNIQFVQLALCHVDDVSLKKQNTQNAEVQAADKKSKSSSTKDSSKAASGTTGGRRDIRVGAGDYSRKRKRDDVGPAFLHATAFLMIMHSNPWLQDDGARKPELKLLIPDLLKVVLVDDWEHITKNHMVCRPPAQLRPNYLLNKRVSSCTFRERRASETCWSSLNSMY
jgi:hypothetical protein